MLNKKPNLLTILILLFTIVPLIELILLYKISSLTNWYFTIILVIITGIVGAYLAKKEGRGVISKIKTKLSSGNMPGDELINGLIIIVGSAFLLTPGILTDFIGFTLVIPITRTFYIKLIKKWFSKKL